MAEVQISSADDNSAAEASEASKLAEAKAALYDEQQSVTDAENGKILGKYDSVDELAAAYQELQRAYNKQGVTPPAEELQDSDPRASEPESEFEEEEEEDGDIELSSEQVQQITNSLYSLAGGQQEYQKLTAWAADNVTEERKDAWNEALNTADVGSMEAQLKSFMWDMQQQRGFEPKLGGGRSPSNEAKAFNSEAEVVEMMNDPRYRDPARRDPAFVREVEKRIAMSNVFEAM